MKRPARGAAPQRPAGTGAGYSLAPLPKKLGIKPGTSVARMAARVADGGGMWIAWPKLGPPLASDVRESAVRDAALAEGLVDYKVCAIDATWYGLKFARRK